MKRNIINLICVAMVVISAIGAWYYLRPRNQGPPKQVVVCIDPGHPSETNSGRRLQHGVAEVEINWQVACKVESILQKDARIRVVKTRNGPDQYVRNRDRALVANKEKAAIAVHLHCDAGPSRGYTLYYPDGQGISGDRNGPPAGVCSSSKTAAETIHSAMTDSLGDVLRDRGIKGESHTRIGRLRGALTTSIWSEVPTVTIEMVFLSNRSDAEYITSEYGQWEMAAAIAAGVENYIKPQLDSLNK